MPRRMWIIPLGFSPKSHVKRKKGNTMRQTSLTKVETAQHNWYVVDATDVPLGRLASKIAVILMGKNNVEGVYDSDPRTNPNAKLLKKLTFQETVEKQLQVMDLTAVAQLEKSKIKIHVFNMEDPENIMRVLMGEDVGSVISEE